ncbi:MAG: leucyl aminopeptidase [Acidobacteria bacterium RIFCSPLOWO2_02_FULL_67_36]|nr:MAG: leucyl aminopeptidase [Acidobacteria bacterium RIFCSPLOWO2_02_FULL_67_36]OFW23677.1 MAG: leucyl aminopeptidase [Acidobacteria bacterium RIFCSPLOWO2_12_FULL_66_21]
MSAELLSASTIAVRDCMGAIPGETVLIVTDEPLRSIGYALRQAAKDLGHEVVLVEMLPRRTNGEEPPAPIADLMTKVDVVLCPTSKSLTHTDARRAASAAGVRVGTLPGVTEEIMVRCMNADYTRIAARTATLCALMEQTRIVRVQAPAGTDITMPIEGRHAHASNGLFRHKGEWGNLPTGEAYLAPLEGRSNGVVVVDGSMAGIGLVSSPLRIVVKDGFAEEITGGAEAQRLVALLEPHGRDARTVAEFGIGTNDRARLTGVILEDEKVMGTIHIALGDNKSMGGSVRVASHLDGLITKPTVWFDDRKIMDAGRFVGTGSPGF